MALIRLIVNLLIAFIYPIVLLMVIFCIFVESQVLFKKYWIMRKKISKKVILNLIKDDLKHQHTICGLNMLGFKNDNSVLGISKSIFSIMELNTHDRRLEHLTDGYYDRAYRVTEIAVNDLESFDRLAVEIYNWLLKEKRTYQKRLSKN